MLHSLRGRLLLSYLVVIAAALLIVTLALLAISSAPAVRVTPVLRQLNTIGLGVRREMAVLLDRGADLDAIQRSLVEIARDQNVRLLLVNRENQRIIFDSRGGDESWMGTVLRDVERLRGEQNDLDPATPVGRYRAPEGTRWLVYGQSLAGRAGSRFLLLAARAEPAVVQIFREVFLRPICQAGIVALLLSISLAWLISRSVARPLQRLAGAAEAIARGNYDQQLDLQGPDEVRRVAGSFNAMSDRVAASQQSQRDFVANVSHDLKTPLTSIRGWSQALLDGTAVSSSEMGKAAEVIHSEASRMERLVDQLLDLARIESGQLEMARETVDVSALLAEVQERFALRAGEGHIDLVVDAPISAPIVGDRDRLAQVLGNLVENALAHTPPRGRIRLSAHPAGEGRLEIQVQDTGTGIPARDLERIFERFYQTDKSRVNSGQRGSGLGLAIVKELVEAHGGAITVNSATGRGTTFTISLPTATPV